MSISSLNSQIDSLNREIYSLEQGINSLDNSIHSKQKEAHRIVESINKEKDLNRRLNYSKDLTRKNEEISRIEKDKFNKEKTNNDKKKKRTDLQLQLSNEEKKERDKIKKENEQLLSLQQQISREMEMNRFKSTSLITNLKPATVSKQYDVFVSHASEDKDFVDPFVAALKAEGLKVWYDSDILEVGNSLRRAIDKGLRNSKYGILVLSNFFFNKEWPQKELDALFEKVSDEEDIILPLWHKISKDEVRNYSHTISGIAAINTSILTTDEIAKKIADKVLNRNFTVQQIV